MWGVVAIIPIVCCILIPAVIAVVAFTGLGKKKPNDDNVRDGELPREGLLQSTQLEQDRK